MPEAPNAFGIATPVRERNEAATREQTGARGAGTAGPSEWERKGGDADASARERQGGDAGASERQRQGGDAGASARTPCHGAVASIRFIDPAADRWRAPPGDAAPIEAFVGALNLLLTRAQWHAVRSAWPADVPVGLVVENDVDVETLALDLPALAIVALRFPQWTDGRAYSQARLLRSRFAFTGEIRATGEVLVDMLPLLVRTGFDAAVLRADQSLDAARRALSFFGHGHYQGDVGAPLPRFRRIDEVAA